MYRLLICLVAIVVAGCGTETKAPTEAAKPNLSPSHSAATPVVTPPQMPGVAKKNSPTGATAFANYVIAVRNYALRTGDTRELRSLIDPECFTCLDAPTLIEAAYRAGGRIEGGLWEQKSKMTLVPCPSCGGWEGRGFLQGAIQVEPTEIVSRDGRSLGTYPGTTRDRGITLSASWHDGRWYVDDIGAIV